MRLLACHIENFGKLSDVTMEFSDPVRVILEPNAWGKSTLAAFLKAMLYGLDARRDKKEYEKERKMYMPWQGGVFGGTLDLETEGRRYRIQRTFGRTEKTDSFLLFDLDTNLESGDFDRHIGETLFDLDSNSFKNSVYIRQNDALSTPTDGIHAKLGNLVEATNDINHFEEASGRLKDLLNHMSPTRATGTIRRRTNYIEELTQELKSFESADESLAELSVLREEKLRERDELSERRHVLTDELQKSGERSLLEEKRRQYEALCEEERQVAEKCEAYKEQFPAGVPSEEELRHVTGLMRQAADAEVTIRNLNEEAVPGQRISKLRQQFRESVPKKEQLAHQIGIQQKLMQEKEELAGLQEELSELDNALRTQENEEWEKNRKQRRSNRRERKRGRRVSGAAVIAVVFAVLAVGLFAAAALLQFVFPAEGIWANAPMGLAVAGFFFAVGILLFAAASGGGASGQGADADDGEISDEIEMVEFSDENVTANRRVQLRDRISEKQEEIYRSQKHIANFLEAYKKNVTPDNALALLYELSHDIEDYERIEHKQDLVGDASRRRDILREQIGQFAENYRLTLGEDIAASLSEIQSKAAAYRALLSEHEKCVRKREQFEQSNDMEPVKAKELPEGGAEQIRAQLKELEQQLEENRLALEKCATGMEQLQKQLDLRDERAYELKNSMELQEEELHRYEIVSLTQEYLTKAREQFTARYMAPVSKAFRRYYEMITAPSEWQIDANIAFKAREQGKLREVWELSQGYQDLIGFCMRIALVDVMYEKEKPFLILDDPFVNLDEDKLTRARELLNEIAKEYQIIYFTCHPSRTPA